MSRKYRWDLSGEHLADIPVGDCVGEFGYVNKRGIEDPLEHVSTSCGGRVRVASSRGTTKPWTTTSNRGRTTRRAVEELFAKKLIEQAPST